jgi:hypothetical protein
MIVTGGIFMADCYGDGSNLTYKEYSSEDTELNIAMDYVSGWNFQESRGAYGSYAQVQFYGAVKGDFAPSIVITAQRSAKAAFSPKTVDGLADDLVGKRMHFEDAEVLSRSDTEILGLPAVDIQLSYKKPDQLRSIDFNLILFHERVVIFQKGDTFYTLRYVNPQQGYQEFEEAFLQGIKTLRFK